MDTRRATGRLCVAIHSVIHSVDPKCGSARIEHTPIAASRQESIFERFEQHFFLPFLRFSPFFRRIEKNIEEQ